MESNKCFNWFTFNKRIMRIIRKGKIIPKEWEQTCSKCNCLFAFTNSDIKTDRDGSYLICPTCNKYLTPIKSNPTSNLNAEDYYNK